MLRMEESARALERLLLELFDGEEFRLFLRRLRGGRQLEQALVGRAASAEALISEAVGLLERRGLLDRSFFEALLVERPAQAARIREVARGWGVDLAELAGSGDRQTSNPYDESHPALPPRFVGRGRVLVHLEGALIRRQGVTLVGDRRIGKSSTLGTWALRLRGAGRTTCLLNGQGPEGASLPELLRAITGRASPPGPDEAADALSRWAEEDARRGLPPVVLIDEAETPLTRLDYRFWERLRGMDGRVLLVLATASELDQVFQERQGTSPFGNTLHQERLGLLEAEGVEQIVGWARGLLSHEAQEQLKLWAGRHPYYLQLFGRLLVDEGKVGSALDHLRDTASGRLRELWKHLSAREQQELERVGQGGRTSFARLRWRGLVDEEGRAFGEILRWWLMEGRP